MPDPALPGSGHERPCGSNPTLGALRLPPFHVASCCTARLPLAVRWPLGAGRRRRTGQVLRFGAHDAVRELVHADRPTPAPARDFDGQPAARRARAASAGAAAQARAVHLLPGHAARRGRLQVEHLRARARCAWPHSAPHRAADPLRRGRVHGGRAGARQEGARQPAGPQASRWPLHVSAASGDCGQACSGGALSRMALRGACVAPSGSLGAGGGGGGGGGAPPPRRAAAPPSRAPCRRPPRSPAAGRARGRSRIARACCARAR